MVSFFRRVLACACFALGAFPVPARADAEEPSLRGPRGRPCCALAADMAIHLGSAHVPIVISGVVSARGVGRHSYLKDGELTENNGLVYTRRGGFIDTAHTRDNADTAAHLALVLRPLLARGGGVLDLGEKGADRRVRILRRVPEAELARVSDLLAIRIAFHLSVWTELVQYYGLTKYRGAEEIYSAFTVDDLYSNLLGATLGIAALESAVPYDRAMDLAFRAALDTLGPVSQAETRRVLAELAGRWWSPDYAWPAPEIAILRHYAIGPKVPPVLAPEAVIAQGGEPVILDVPQTDRTGAELAEYYQLELRPHARELERFPPQERGRVLAEADIPRLVEEVHRALDADTARSSKLTNQPNEASAGRAVAHYMTGIRLLELSVSGGASASPRLKPAGVEGGGFALIHGETRGGDFKLMSLAALHSPSRGLMGGLAFFNAQALWFCHDPETHELRAPLVSLLGPCEAGEWLGLAGSLGEAIHDGSSGRTALRPIRLAAVLNPLENGQSASYDTARLLVDAGAEVEHVWSDGRGGRTIPRAGGSVSLLLRTPSEHFELRGAAGYRLNPGAPRDAAFESDLAFAYNFLLGGASAPSAHQRVDPWGLASLALDGSYAYWRVPENAFAELTAPFVSTEQRSTWQVLTGTLGIERLSF